MKVHVARLTLIASIVLASFALGSAAGAATYDSSFHSGAALLRGFHGTRGAAAQTCRVVGSKIYVSSVFGYGRPPGSGKRIFATNAISISGRAHAAGASWRRQGVKNSDRVIAQAFASDGSFVFVSQPVRYSEETHLTVYRTRVDQHRDKSFGHNGTLPIYLDTHPIAGINAAGGISIGKDGSLLLTVQTAATIEAIRITSAGKVDTTWGSNGVVTFPLPQKTTYFLPFLTTSARLLDDGSAIVAAGGVPGSNSPNDSGGLVHLNSNGSLDTAFASGGFWTAPAPANPAAYWSVGRPMLTAQRSDGTIEVVYGDSQAGTDLFEGTTTLRRALIFGAGSTQPLNADLGASKESARLWLLQETAVGTAFGFGRYQLGAGSGTFETVVARLANSTSIKQKPAQVKINTNGFATGAWTADPATGRIYACGSLGRTSNRLGNPGDRNLSKQIAIRRLAL